MFNYFFGTPTPARSTSTTKTIRGRVDLVCFIPSSEREVLLLMEEACLSAGGWTSTRYTPPGVVYFSIPTGHLPGVDFYIQLLEVCGLEWFLKTR
ncbi:MAG: hypothetical protein B7C55_01875 [Actinomycetales bacterium mxb001]|nr:MAG: hypothetical protein B7C55_01875 [Actinomycetales bacterium mxb001]